MTRHQCRGSIAQAAVVIGLLFSSRPADAQVVVNPGPIQQPRVKWNGLGTGVQYDIVNQALAERRLQKLQARFRRDAERGDPAAVERDAGRIDYTRYRIAVDEWLIRMNSLQYPGCYPIRTDAVCWPDVYAVSRGPRAPDPWQPPPTAGAMVACPADCRGVPPLPPPPGSFAR